MEIDPYLVLASNAAWQKLGLQDIGRGRPLLLDELPSSGPGRGGPSHAFGAPASTSSPWGFAPPPRRTALKKRSRSPAERGRRSVGFCPSVDVRVSLVAPHPQGDAWYSRGEIRAMRLEANGRSPSLGHSERVPASAACQVRETIGDVPARQGRPPLSRALSAKARLGEGEDPDAEVYISVEQRRGSSRRRLEHYANVLDEIDRQADEGYSRINTGELARVGRASSERSLQVALDRGGAEAATAQEILLRGAKRRV